MRRYNLIGFVLVLGSIGCASFTKARLNRISNVHTGLTTSEVVAAIGEPDEKLTTGDGETWYYDIYADDSSRTYPYTAQIKNKRLSKFFADTGRASAFRDLCAKRKNADQTILFPRSDGSPAINAQSCGD